MAVLRRSADATVGVVTALLRQRRAIIAPVIRHVVLWAFKEAVAPAERDAIVAAIRALRTTVPPLRSLEVGENVNPARAQGYTHVLLETFDDRDGLAAYATHPEHVPVLARLRDAVSQLIAVDLEV
jgi:hypothetical protein